ncbi:MAG: DMT family transporter [Wenzhouxiangellaceae bacterium]
MTPEPPRNQALWWVAAGAALISLAAPLVKGTSVEPTLAAICRMWFGSLTLGLLLLINPEWRRGWRRGWGASALIALFFALDLWFWHRSIHWLSPGLATLLANFQVFLLPLLGRVIYAEKPAPRFFIGLLLAAGGLWLLFGHNWQQFTGLNRWGVVYGVLTAVAYAAYTLTLRHAQSGGQAPAASARLFQVSLLCTILLVIDGWIEGLDFFAIHGSDWLRLIALGVLCQVFGWILIARGLPGVAAAIAGLLLLLQPSLSLVWDFLFFGLQLSTLQIIGVLLALAGIYFGTRVRRPRPARTPSTG